MLPKSRIFSALLVGLGLALVAAGLIAPRFLDANSRMPLDSGNTTWTLEDSDGAALIHDEQGTRPYQGPLTYQLHMAVQEPSGKDVATLRIGETTVRAGSADEAALADVNNLVGAQVWTYSIDRVTGAAASPANINHTIATPASEAQVPGYWLKFPADAEKTNYPVFDPYIRDAVDAVFEEELEIDGRTIYRYHQAVEPTNVATKFAGAFNTSRTETEGGDSEQTYLYHSATRDYFVDQATGALVAMEVSIDDYYGDREGNRTEDAFVFEAATSDDDRAAFIAQAADLPAPGTLTTIAWVVVGAGALLTLLGLAGVCGLFGRSSQSGSRRGPAAQNR